MTNQNDIASVAVFIPAFNEEQKIGETIDRLRSTYSERRMEQHGFQLKIIVIDDGSTDRTLQIAKSKNVDLICVHKNNMGLGAATRTGMLAARDLGVSAAIKLDADLQHDPEDIEKVIRVILNNHADICYGSRFAGEIKYRMPVIRFLGNKFFTWLMRLMTGWKITDAQTGLMAYSKHYLEIFDMPGDYNPPQQTLIDAFHKGMRYGEVPVVFEERTTGKSFVTLKYPFHAISQILRLIVFLNPLKFFVPVGVFFLLLAVILSGIELYLNMTGHMTNFHDGALTVLLVFAFQTIFFGLLADLVIGRDRTKMSSQYFTKIYRES